MCYIIGYSVSKIGVNILTSLMADELLGADSCPGILVNSVCHVHVHVYMYT